MKSVRVIARLDVKGSNVVKGIQTEGLRIVGDPAKLALKYYTQGADEILYMDIVASLYDRNLDFDQLKRVSDKIFIPMTVGGGIRTIKDINDALRAGADKVAINTFGIRCPELLSESVHNFGSQCIVLSVEAKKIGENRWEAYTEGGREKTGVDAIEWIQRAIALGIGEIIVTSIDQDGTKKGYDLDLLARIAQFSPVPVIAHGGAGDPEDVVKVIKYGKADAVSASSIYHYDLYNVSNIKERLQLKNIRTRIV